tara:strand:+ start:138 stop:497 length:360 start_codon:yes stop_codon:yes gene_type:complete
MSLFTNEELKNIKEVLTEGLLISANIDIPGLTIKIWEAIAKLPHPIDSTFNLLGNSAILNVLNENDDKIVNIHIKPDILEFELAKPEYQYTQSDRTTLAFAVMATTGVWTKTKLLCKQN